MRRLAGSRRGGMAVRIILLLGLVSLLTDISSEMTLALLPVYLTGTLGASVAVVGVVEGIGESTAALSRLAGGRLSDRTTRRLPLVMGGYGLSALSKPLLALAATPAAVGALRFSDRLGKGIRTPPRDALIADVATAERRGLAFGVHRAADTAGAVLGLLGAAALVALLGGEAALTRSDFQAVVLVAAIPAFLAVALLLRVPEPRRAPPPPAAGRWFHPPRGAAQRRYLLAIGLFALGNSSDAFLILRLLDRGADVVEVLLILALMNAVYAAAATPAGILSDRLGRRPLLLIGYAAYAALYAGFAVAGSLAAMLALTLLYGLYFGATEAAGRALVADLAAPAERGTLFGWFHMITAVAALPASIIAGMLWTEIGPGAAFSFGAGAAVAAALALATVRPPARAVSTAPAR